MSFARSIYTEVPTDPNVAINTLLDVLSDQINSRKSRERPGLFTTPATCNLSDSIFIRELVKACRVDKESKSVKSELDLFLEFLNRENAQTLIEGDSAVMRGPISEFFSYFPEYVRGQNIQVNDKVRSELTLSFQWVEQMMTRFPIDEKKSATTTASSVPQVVLGEEHDDVHRLRKCTQETFSRNFKFIIDELRFSAMPNQTSPETDRILQVIQCTMARCDQDTYSALLHGLVDYLTRTNDYTDTTLAMLNRCLQFTARPEDFKSVADALLADMKGSVLIYVCKEKSGDIFTTYRIQGIYPHYEKQFGKPVSPINHLLGSLLSSPHVDEQTRYKLIEALFDLRRKWELPDYRQNVNALYQAWGIALPYMNAAQFVEFKEKTRFGADFNSEIAMACISNIENKVQGHGVSYEIIEQALQYMKSYIAGAQRQAVMGREAVESGRVDSWNPLANLRHLAEEYRPAILKLWQTTGQAIAKLTPADRVWAMRQITKIFLQDESLFNDRVDDSFYCIQHGMKILCAQIRMAIPELAMKCEPQLNR